MNRQELGLENVVLLTNKAETGRIIKLLNRCINGNDNEPEADALIIMDWLDANELFKKKKQFCYEYIETDNHILQINLDNNPSMYIVEIKESTMLNTNLINSIGGKGVPFAVIETKELPTNYRVNILY